MEDEEIRSFSTADYKLHYFETLSGLRIVMLTDPHVKGTNTNALDYGIHSNPSSM